jgi:hypothetical protein
MRVGMADDFTQLAGARVDMEGMTIDRLRRFLAPQDPPATEEADLTEELPCPPPSAGERTRWRWLDGESLRLRRGAEKGRTMS